jgi:dUTPase
MLDRKQIEDSKLIDRGIDSGYRAASYDLRVGRIIRPDGEDVDAYVVPPQGIVEVISAERMQLPSNICGFATVKTSLSTNGILALNIGIIDPMYEGLISSFMLNFSRVPFRLEKDDIFLRTYFIHLPNSEYSLAQSGQRDDQYVKDKKAKIVGRFGETFLNVDEIASRVVRENLVRIAGFASLVALIIGIFSFGANASVLALMRSWVDPRTSVETQITDRFKNDLNARDMQIRDLRLQIDNLENSYARGMDNNRKK